jgi:hypothetical protein
VAGSLGFIQQDDGFLDPAASKGLTGSIETGSSVFGNSIGHCVRAKKKTAGTEAPAAGK